MEIQFCPQQARQVQWCPHWVSKVFRFRKKFDVFGVALLRTFQKGFFYKIFAGIWKWKLLLAKTTFKWPREKITSKTTLNHSQFCPQKYSFWRLQKQKTFAWTFFLNLGTNWDTVCAPPCNDYHFKDPFVTILYWKFFSTFNQTRHVQWCSLNKTVIIKASSMQWLPQVPFVITIGNPI